MLKVKKIKVSGFRGISLPQDIELMKSGEKEPSSFVLYGLNSSGKTSFVDGLEWFLSPGSKIEWLQREEAQEKAYPHQCAKENESYVELEFYDSDKKINTLKKQYNHKKITQPNLYTPTDFNSVYGSFTIKPYLRYLEVINFVYNLGGVEKYEKLASWMGFEAEFAFQQKMALEIIPELKKKLKELLAEALLYEKPLKELLGDSITEEGLLKKCNDYLKICNAPEVKKLNDLWDSITKVSSAQRPSAIDLKVAQLNEIQTVIPPKLYDISIKESIEKLSKEISEFSSHKEAIKNLDAIDLYTKALDIISASAGTASSCPVCDTKWERETLLSNIRKKLELIQSTKQKKDKIIVKISELKSALKTETNQIKRTILKYEQAKKILSTIDYSNLKKYDSYLSELYELSDEEYFNNTAPNNIDNALLSELDNERFEINKLLVDEVAKLQPSKEELSINDAVIKLKTIKESWINHKEAASKHLYYSAEATKFVELCESMAKQIQEGIKKRFDEISVRIGKYFALLRHDKDIKEIKIVLNEEKGKAAGRSAEIQLNYYDISVKPAYKVLSESLLNSLGLAVYFTCVKQFNNQCKAGSII